RRACRRPPPRRGRIAQRTEHATTMAPAERQRDAERAERGEPDATVGEPRAVCVGEGGDAEDHQRARDEPADETADQGRVAPHRGVVASEERDRGRGEAGEDHPGVLFAWQEPVGVERQHEPERREEDASAEHAGPERSDDQPPDRGAPVARRHAHRLFTTTMPSWKWTSTPFASASETSASYGSTPRIDAETFPFNPSCITRLKRP